MKLGIRAKLFLLSLGLSVVSVVLAYGYAKSELEVQLMDDTRADLAVRVELMAAAAAAEPLARLSEPAVLAELSKRAGGAGLHVLSAEGSTLARSDRVNDTLPRGAEADVAVARRGRVPRAAQDFYMDGRTLYASAPMRSRDGAPVIVRLALPLAGVDAAVASLRDTLLSACALALAIAVLMASIATRLTLRSVRTLTDVARKMAEGDLQARSRFKPEAELAELGGTLDKLAHGLSHTLEELRAERDRLSGILQGMQEGVLLLDADRRIAVLNPALREMLLLPADAIGKPLLEVVRHAELKDLFDAAHTATEPIVREVELGNIKPRRLLARVARVPGVQRKVFAVFQDVTEMRRLESMRRDFVANVSHELRTPVTAIRSAAETLTDGASDDPAASKAFIGIIERNAQRLHALVEDLLDLSRIEARGFRLNLEPIELRATFSQVLGLFRERAAKKNVELAERAYGEVPRVRGDRRALEHVLTNLIDNAVKYCGPGSVVSVGVTVEQDLVTVNVTDDGPGIEERHLSRIFERFYRVDAGRSRDVGGTGLGLSIVKHLVEAMGGTVSVESQLNVGTTFSFTLKRAEAPAEQDTRAVA